MCVLAQAEAFLDAQKCVDAVVQHAEKQRSFLDRMKRKG